MKRRFRLPSPAMVVAVAALALSVTSTATAAVVVTSANIQNNTIRSVDIRNGAINGIDVKRNTLTGSDVKESTLGRVPLAANATNAGMVDGVDSKALIAPSVVPAGRTVYGLWGVDGDSDGTGDVGSSISYPIPMPTDLTEVVVPSGGSNPNCPGNVNDPKANPGFACIYLSHGPIGGTGPFVFTSNRFGAELLLADDNTPGDIYAIARWAATAPLAGTTVAASDEAENEGSK